ncbi:hypothetical protein OROMI_033721 [Orobanche minor]
MGGSRRKVTTKNGVRRGVQAWIHRCRCLNRETSHISAFIFHGTGASTEKRVIFLLLFFMKKVPQQRNEYDCGLFVLYFMQRFLEEVPDMRNKSHLEMFGKKWFKPEEASRLRTSIRKFRPEEHLLMYCCYHQFRKKWFKNLTRQMKLVDRKIAVNSLSFLKC